MEKSSSIPFWLLTIWMMVTLIWWAFAFMPTPEVSPEWLTAARNACFGSLENGLPDAYGWMILILGPASFLVGLLVTWWDEFRQAISKLTTWNPRSLLFLLVCLNLFGIEGVWVAKKIISARQLSSMDFRSEILTDLPMDYPYSKIPYTSFELVDHVGRSVRMDDILKDNTVILSFAYAHCQSVCPALVEQLKGAIHSLNPGRVRLLLITLDPRRDTPSSLPGLASRWNLPPNAHLLSGSVPVVESVLRSFNVPFSRDSSSGEIDHPALIYVFGEDLAKAYTFNNAPSKWIVQAVERLALAQTYGRN